MSRTILIALFCSLLVLGESRGQDVFVPRQLKQLPVIKPEVEPSTEAQPTKPAPGKETAATNHESTTKFEPVRAMPKKETASRSPASKTEPAKAPATKEAVVSTNPEKPSAAKPDPAKPSTTKETASKSETEKTHPPKTESTKAVATKEPAKSSKTQGAKTDSAKVAKEESATKLEEEKPKIAKTESKKPNAEKPSASKESAEKSDQEKPRVAKTESNKTNSEKEKTTAAKAPASKSGDEKARVAKTESTKANPEKPSASKESVAKSEEEKPRVAKKEPAKTTPEKPSVTKEMAAKSNDEKAPVAKTEPTVHVPSESTRVVKLDAVKPPDLREPTADVQLMNGPVETASTKLADGFDFPVGKPDADGYYRARGFRSGGHMGEDWDGVRGGDTDLRDPIYCVGDGVVVFARDVHLGWGNVVIVRHAFREDGTIKHIDSLYGHLHSILVKRGQRVARGQQIGTMGTAHGQDHAHLHLEIRKNIEIGMSKSKFQKDLSNYHDPSKFITSHRHIAGGGASFRVAMNTFTHDGAFHFDSAPNFGARKRSTSQSSAALRRALSNGTSSQRE